MNIHNNINECQKAYCIVLELSPSIFNQSKLLCIDI